VSYTNKEFHWIANIFSLLAARMRTLLSSFTATKGREIRRL